MEGPCVPLTRTSNVPYSSERNWSSIHLHNRSVVFRTPREADFDWKDLFERAKKKSEWTWNWSQFFSNIFIVLAVFVAYGPSYGGLCAKITVSCQICLQWIFLNVSKNKNELWKTFKPTSIQKPQLTSFQSSSSLSIPASLCIIGLSGYFHCSIVAVPTLWILINFVTQLL